MKVKMVKKKKHQIPHHHVSTFSLANAYSSTCLAKFEELSSNNELVFISFSVDCRSQLGPPIPVYFGNFITLKFAFIERLIILLNKTKCIDTLYMPGVII